MKKHYILFTFLLLGGHLLQAQFFPYYFSVEDEATYTPLTDSISLNEGAIWDDPDFMVPLGFDFDLYDYSTNTILIGGVATFAFPDAMDEALPIIIPYGSDIIDIGEINGIESESEISYKIEGAAGNKIAKIEWKNVGFYDEVSDLGTANNTLSFQLWLYEGSNDIEIHFGPNDIEDDALVHGGIGPFAGIINGYNFNTDELAEFWYLTGDPQSPTIDTLLDLENYEDFIGLDDDPANGTIYRFSTGFPTALSNPVMAQNVRVYPTVADDFIQVEIKDLSLNESSSIAIYNGTGKRITEQPIEAELTRIEVKHLVPGIYFIHINTGAGLTTKKIIKG